MISQKLKQNSQNAPVSQPLREKKYNLKIKNSQNIARNLEQEIPRGKSQNAKYSGLNSVKIKDYKFKIKAPESFSQSKMKKPKLSILSNIYKPLSQSKNENEMTNYLNVKNINLIKQNIKKLEYQLPHSVSFMIKNTIKQRSNTLNLSSRNSCRTDRNNSQKYKKDFVFLFDKDTIKMDELLSKRKISHHFDRLKYFNHHENNRNKEQVHSGFMRRQRTQQRLNSHLSRQKQLRAKIQQNQCIVDEVVPIIQQRNKKPKTAGGFLKKYRVQQVCMRPDFQLHLTEDQIF